VAQTAAMILVQPFPDGRPNAAHHMLLLQGNQTIPPKSVIHPGMSTSIDIASCTKGSDDRKPALNTSNRGAQDEIKLASVRVVQTNRTAPAGQ